MARVQIEWTLRAHDRRAGRRTAVAGRASRAYRARQDWREYISGLLEQLFGSPLWDVRARVTGARVVGKVHRVRIEVTLDGEGLVGRGNWLRDQYARLARERPGAAN